MSLAKSKEAEKGREIKIVVGSVGEKEKEEECQRRKRKGKAWPAIVRARRCR